MCISGQRDSLPHESLRAQNHLWKTALAVWPLWRNRRGYSHHHSHTTCLLNVSCVLTTLKKSKKVPHTTIPRLMIRFSWYFLVSSHRIYQANRVLGRGTHATHVCFDLLCVFWLNFMSPPKSFPICTSWCVYHVYETQHAAVAWRLYPSSPPLLLCVSYI